MREEEGKKSGEKKHSKHRKIAAIIIVIIIIQVSSVSIWYVYFRPWTIRDVAKTTDIDFDEINGDNFLMMYTEDENLGFSHDMVGQQKIVKGRITDITTYLTPIGPLTYYELDDFEGIHMVEWDMPSYKVGNEIEKKVSFEWSSWNEDRIVCSPQLDFPSLRGGYLMQREIDYISRRQGIILMANQTLTDGEITISVILPRGEGFPLALFNCTLRRGRSSRGSDVHDAFNGYRNNPIVDSISSLTNISGANNIIRFSDDNQNGLLDDGDYFTFTATRPKEDSAILTYFFTINNYRLLWRERILSGECFIIMTNRGPFSHLSCPKNMYNTPPYMITKVIDEEERPVGITTRIIIERVINEPPPLTDSYCELSPRFSSMELVDGEIDHEWGTPIIFSDANANRLLDTGDIVRITGLDNRTKYGFYFRWMEEGDGLIVRGGSIVRGGFVSHLKWTTGIGMDTGNLPVIQFRGQNITDTNLTSTFMIDIERMYGIPGLNLSLEDPGRWFRIHLVRDDQEIVPTTNLSLDFEINNDEFNITFLDMDANEFINTGDRFLFEGGPGSYSLILDYVKRDWEEEEGFRNLHSQSFSWTI